MCIRVALLWRIDRHECPRGSQRRWLRRLEIQSGGSYPGRQGDGIRRSEQRGARHEAETPWLRGRKLSRPSMNGRHGTRHSRVSTALIALPDAGPGDSQRTLVSRIYTGPAEAGTGLPGVYGTRRTSWRRALR